MVRTQIYADGVGPCARELAAMRPLRAVKRQSSRSSLRPVVPLQLSRRAVARTPRRSSREAAGIWRDRTDHRAIDALRRAMEIGTEPRRNRVLPATPTSLLNPLRAHPGRRCASEPWAQERLMVSSVLASSAANGSAVGSLAEFGCGKAPSTLVRHAPAVAASESLPRPTPTIAPARRALQARTTARCTASGYSRTASLRLSQALQDAELMILHRQARPHLAADIDARETRAMRLVMLRGRSSS